MFTYLSILSSLNKFSNKKEIANNLKTIICKEISIRQGEICYFFKTEGYA